VQSLGLGVEASLSRDDDYRRSCISQRDADFRDLGEAFEGYWSRVPSDWAPPVPTQSDVAGFADALRRSDVSCLLALDDEEVIGHMALIMEDPEPVPVGTISLCQLFVRPPWQGRERDLALGDSSQRSSAASVHADAPVDAAGRPESSPPLL
jgi:Acetyltransferase (GNAT) family